MAASTATAPRRLFGIRLLLIMVVPIRRDEFDGLDVCLRLYCVALESYLENSLKVPPVRGKSPDFGQMLR
ncbi:MAG: hypothetical protein WDZ48_07385 [Pirellulales bacterium]